MSWIAVLAKEYGSTSIHLVSLIVIWMLMVQPEMERNRITFAEQQSIVKQMQDIVSARTAMAETYLQGGRSQEAAAATIMQAASVMDKTSKRLEAITDAISTQSRIKAAGTSPTALRPGQDSVISVNPNR